MYIYVDRNFMMADHVVLVLKSSLRSLAEQEQPLSLTTVIILSRGTYTSKGQARLRTGLEQGLLTAHSEQITPSEFKQRRRTPPNNGLLCCSSWPSAHRKGD